MQHAQFNPSFHSHKNKYLLSVPYKLTFKLISEQQVTKRIKAEMKIWTVYT
jgi:hypothetical protein